MGDVSDAARGALPILEAVLRDDLIPAVRDEIAIKVERRIMAELLPRIIDEATLAARHADEEAARDQIVKLLGRKFRVTIEEVAGGG